MTVLAEFGRAIYAPSRLARYGFRAVMAGHPDDSCLQLITDESGREVGLMGDWDIIGFLEWLNEMAGAESLQIEKPAP